GDANRRSFEAMQRLGGAGNKPLQYFLGMMYLSGDGFGSEGPAVPRDPAKGIEWLRRASEGGAAPVQYFLGTSYLLGRGIPQDLGQGILWLRRAAEQGYAQA